MLGPKAERQESALQLQLRITDLMNVNAWLSCFVVAGSQAPGIPALDRVHTNVHSEVGEPAFMAAAPSSAPPVDPHLMTRELTTTQFRAAHYLRLLNRQLHLYCIIVQ